MFYIQSMNLDMLYNKHIINGTKYILHIEKKSTLQITAKGWHTFSQLDLITIMSIFSSFPAI